MPKALGAWDMGEPKNVGGGKAKPLGEPPLGADGSKGAWWMGAHGERSEPKSDRHQATERGGRGFCANVVPSCSKQGMVATVELSCSKKGLVANVVPSCSKQGMVANVMLSRSKQVMVANIMSAKNRRTGAGRIIFRRRKALLWGSPLGGRWVAGLMIEGEAIPPLKRGLALSSIGKPAGWAGGLLQRCTQF